MRLRGALPGVLGAVAAIGVCAPLIFIARTGGSGAAAPKQLPPAGRPRAEQQSSAHDDGAAAGSSAAAEPIAEARVADGSAVGPPGVARAAPVAPSAIATSPPRAAAGGIAVEGGLDGGVPPDRSWAPRGLGRYCAYRRGRWVGNLTWVPAAEPGCPYREYTQEMAFRCLQGKQVVLWGNSNTRAMYSALEGILKDKTITPRLEAKQACENNPKNHSCGQDVALPGYANVTLFYWGYVHDVWDRRLAPLFRWQRGPNVALVLGNAGPNTIQKHREDRWRRDHREQIPRLNAFLRDTFSPETARIWMTSTRICESQPHFKKYIYKPKFWLHRPLERMNAEIAGSNHMVLEGLDHSIPQLKVLHAAALVSNPRICPYYDDPLHHKAVDRALAHVVLNMHCNSRLGIT
eukprot:TRINITY_DN27737_c0_g1_i1.p1 TRINITY_DN27737_c0_g1~~TRINITY_DN27737_c0_g1_i1.p1  ORF type:complete len:433 (+),score=91.02 TRINITY_DN27737_c0_g1_i1:85-1299(+)